MGGGVVAEEMESASIARNRKLLFHQVTCSPSPITILKEKNGKPTYDPQEQVCRFAEHFCEVFGSGIPSIQTPSWGKVGTTLIVRQK